MTSELFKGLQHFANIAQPSAVQKHLIYGGDENLIRQDTQVTGWKDIE